MTLTSTLGLSALALAVALPGGALADAHEPAPMTSGRLAPSNLETMLRSSDLIGGSVYTMVGDDMVAAEDWSSMAMFDTVGDTWETIGTVQEVVLSRDGQLTGFVVEDAGFLGFGDDNVLLEMSVLRMIDDGSGTISWVTNITQAQFESMPEVQETWY